MLIFAVALNRVALLFLHGGFPDELIFIGVAAYLIVMFGLAQLKTRRLKRKKLRRRAERAANLGQPVAPLTSSAEHAPSERDSKI